MIGSYDRQKLCDLMFWQDMLHVDLHADRSLCAHEVLQ